jgi:hypothetical protein
MKIPKNIQADIDSLGVPYFLFGSREISSRGARLFHTNGSDWDVAIEPIQSTKLSDLGFTEHTGEMYYPDLMHMTCWDKTYEDGEKCQISIKKSLQLFKSVWNELTIDQYDFLVHKKSHILDMIPDVRDRKRLLSEFFNFAYRARASAFGLDLGEQ